LLDDDLGEGVALRESWLTTPWPIEPWPASGRSFAWLGTAADGALRFRFWAAEPTVVHLRLEALAGPSRADAERHLSIRGPTGEPEVVRFAGRDRVHLRLQAKAGVNVVEIACPDSPDVPSLPNGDPRRLLAGIADVVLSADRAADAPLRVFR
jgi:hypothetical protein